MLVRREGKLVLHQNLSIDIDLSAMTIGELEELQKEINALLQLKRLELEKDKEWDRDIKRWRAMY